MGRRRMRILLLLIVILLSGCAGTVVPKCDHLDLFTLEYNLEYVENELELVKAQKNQVDTVYVDETIDFTYTVFARDLVVDTYGDETDVLVIVKEGCSSVAEARLYVRLKGKGRECMIVAVAEKWIPVHEYRYEPVK